MNKEAAQCSKNDEGRGEETGFRCLVCLLSACMCTKSLLLCPALGDPLDRSPPGSSVHGILQARMVEWVATFGK